MSVSNAKRTRIAQILRIFAEILVAYKLNSCLHPGLLPVQATPATCPAVPHAGCAGGARESKKIFTAERAEGAKIKKIFSADSARSAVKAFWFRLVRVRLTRENPYDP
jgi:hypothetical protein